MFSGFPRILKYGAGSVKPGMVEVVSVAAVATMRWQWGERDKIRGKDGKDNYGKD